MADPVNSLPPGEYILRRFKIWEQGGAVTMPNPFTVLRALPKLKSMDDRGFEIEVLERRGGVDEERPETT
jgi:hypothetical protein